MSQFNHKNHTFSLYFVIFVISEKPQGMGEHQWNLGIK